MVRISRTNRFPGPFIDGLPHDTVGSLSQSFWDIESIDDMTIDLFCHDWKEEEMERKERELRLNRGMWKGRKGEGYEAYGWR